MGDTPAVSSMRERAWVIAAVALVSVLAWGYLLRMSYGMAQADMGAAMVIMPRMVSWELVDLGLVLAMWAIMMAAMMVPSAAPVLLLFAALCRQLQAPKVHAAWLAFLAGYLAVWCLFSVGATLVQWGLLEATLVSPMMQASSRWLGGALLVATGVYQLTPLKQTCLSKCRSPLPFMAARWRAGVRGAWTMGLQHGLRCLGCCWLLMLLLFVLGVMNLWWIVVLTLFVLLEKTLPASRWFSAAGGAAFLGLGVVLLFGGTPA